MATCARCNKSGWFLWLNSRNQCPVCEAQTGRRLIKRIRAGKLRAIEPSDGLLLDSDESCYLDTKACHVTRGFGQLIATNKRMLFLNEYGVVEVNWKRVMRIRVDFSQSFKDFPWPKPRDAGWFYTPEPDPEKGAVILELSTKSGHGTYVVPHVARAEALFTVLVRLSKMIRPKNSLSRHIPQDVRQTVWLRDDGECVECGSELDLQFDHIIPHSKGGANTVENIRILCRVCNSKKRARI